MIESYVRRIEFFVFDKLYLRKISVFEEIVFVD